MPFDPVPLPSSQEVFVEVLIITLTKGVYSQDSKWRAL